MSDYILALDRPRRLKFGFAALNILQEQLGDREWNEFDKIKVHEMAIFAWAGLIWEDPTLTLEGTRALIDPTIGEIYSMPDIIKLLTSAIIDHVLGGVKPSPNLDEKLKDLEEKQKKNPGRVKPGATASTKPGTSHTGSESGPASSSN